MRLNPNGDVSTFPTRAELPIVAGTPNDSAWFWGGSDELGRLNLLTSQRVVKVAQENVKTGDVISLNLPLDVPSPPFFGRKSFHHEIKSIGKGAFDDEMAMNTQSSSQWDGYRHFACPRSGCHYNGILSDEIMGDHDESEGQTGRSRRLGIDAWAKKGIVGRGVFLDIYSWAQEEKRYDPFTAHGITASDLKACAKAQGVSFQIGDILLVRTGWIAKYSSLTHAEKIDCAKLDTMQHACAGLEASDEMKDFLHDTYFSAGACDNATFEAWPPPSMEGSLHASMLPLWGMPIGELWDFERLTDKCKELSRWTFLLTSSPANVPGGVASSPNALALF
ncbi:hypothetical protein BDU57DRAFT_336645 [Ampelomyces quisqualis]|uniref:Cyclase-domain-containing protein n=1 Tax=Ampelomyces quisqualis TaxID=50730 RepID=A0A6A5QFC6_AMPQU|nr:hypothetical protein BDU57DRAFT_336645 [Ampelomyces quisqualis]